MHARFIVNIPQVHQREGHAEEGGADYEEAVTSPVEAVYDRSGVTVNGGGVCVNEGWVLHVVC